MSFILSRRVLPQGAPRSIASALLFSPALFDQLESNLQQTYHIKVSISLAYRHKVPSPNPCSISTLAPGLKADEKHLFLTVLSPHVTVLSCSQLDGVTMNRSGRQSHLFIRAIPGDHRW